MTSYNPNNGIYLFRVGSLRSRGCFIVVTPRQTVYVWLGSKSTPHAREVAQKAGNEIEDNYISDNFRVVVVGLFTKYRILPLKF